MRPNPLPGSEVCLSICRSVGLSMVEQGDSGVEGKEDSVTWRVEDSNGERDGWDGGTDGQGDRETNRTTWWLKRSWRRQPWRKRLGEGEVG